MGRYRLSAYLARGRWRRRRACEHAASGSSHARATDARQLCSLSRLESKDILVAMRSAEFGNQNPEALRDQYQALLEVTESIASHRDLSELFHDLTQPLRNVLHFDYLSVRLHDPQRNVMRIHILEKSAPGELVPELPV